MKRVVVFLLIAFLCSVAGAKDTIIYNGWVNAGQPFNIGNDTFMANYIFENNVTVVFLPEGIHDARDDFRGFLGFRFPERVHFLLLIRGMDDEFILVFE